MDGTTRKKAPRGAERGRVRWACLTICAHPDLSRVGHRAQLAALRIRKPVEVSRLSPDFGPPRGGARAPLEDPYVSRTPLTLRGDIASGLELRYERDDLRVDGRPMQGSTQLTAAMIERGVVLELADRVVLLLHLSEGGEVDELPDLLGASDGIARVRDHALRVAGSDVAVLIRGETGAGKEAVARAIHRSSARRDKPLLAVNLAALASSMAASALFGHVRGAFTGAIERHAGLFERAHGGTLFLDEIGETPEDVQPMLLRALETGQITPLGATRDLAVDVRVISATDARLEQEIEHGTFRRALFHRLAGFELRVPPLRERREDIGPLFMHFLRQELAAIGESSWLEATPQGAGASPQSGAGAADDPPKVPAALITRLLLHPLDGNVRQLRNIVQRLLLVNRGRAQLELDPDLERMLSAEPEVEPEVAPSPATISDAELLRALEEQRWSPRRTSAVLHIPTSTLYDLMRRCSSIRKAKDLHDQELLQALRAADNDVEKTAAELRVSARALRIVLRERGLLAQQQRN